MRTIWKYEIKPQIEMPEGSEIIHVENQNGVPTLWALVCPNALPVQRSFSIRGTGHPVDSILHHLKSWQDGQFVWHLFEAQPQSNKADE